MTALLSPTAPGRPLDCLSPVPVDGGNLGSEGPDEGQSASVPAVVLVIVAACGAGMVLIICYWACRRALDRRRLAGWESAWALTGPRWTTRR
jgi:hypothetical protein